MNVSAPFIRQPIATTLLMAALLLVGLVAYPLLPVAPLPQVDFPTIQVSASLPGASPETMASSVATPLERQFSQIAGVAQMTSTSALGVASIAIQFDLGRSIDAAAQDVQSAINAASGQLPKNLPSPPTFRKINPADAPILILSVQSDLYPLTKLDDAADTILAQQMSQIPGIAQVAITGEQKPAVRVQVDPAKIAALGMSLEDVRAVLAAATVDQPKGSFDGTAQGFTIYADDQLLTALPWNEVVVAYKNGAPVRIRDIGRAVDGPENARLASWQDGKRGIQLIVFKQPGANVIDAVDRVKAAIPRLEASLPPGITVKIIGDRTETIRASVDDVQLTMLITIALVVAVIFAFLRSLWATIIPSVTVPMALIGTFAVMYVVGYSLDNLSLMALTIAVGFVVDDAIVMLENIYRYIEEGMPPFEAALKGAGEIGFTIISISLSLVAVFIPVLLMGGIVGRLLREFAVTVTITILVSVVVSLTLTPMMCSLFLKNEHNVKHGRAYLAAEAFFDGMLKVYDTGLKWVLSHQFLTLMSLLATVAATGWLYVAIPKGFFPQQDTGFIQGFSEAAQDISFSAMTSKQMALLDIVARDRAIEHVSGSVGATGGSQTINTGRVWITLKPRSERDVTADEVIHRLRPQLAKVEGIALFLQASQDINVGGRASRTQYQYTLQDANLDELNAWGPRMLAKLKSLPELTDVATDQQTNAPTVSLTIDRDTAARFGILPQVIDDTLYDAFGQRQVAQYFTQLSQYHVLLEVDPKLQTDPGALDKVYVRSPRTGEEIPLSAFVKVDNSKTAYLSISHQGQFPAVTLSFNLAPGVALGQAVDAIKQAEQEAGMPQTLIGTFQGTAQAFQNSLRTQPYLILAAIVAVYIILGVLYESFIHPLTILSSLPSAGVGALLVLYVAGYDLSVIALIGILLLIGIVKKNAIMMIDFALVREREGKSPEESIYEACLIRFRPIMMTTMAALLGALPLMLGSGTGSELRRPLGFAIVGGLMVSQVLTLYTTPVVYLYMVRLQRWLTRKRDEPAAPVRLAPVPHLDEAAE
ncbi:HAE1 family hydrophobic/amphiphilic exporter-1/multidrug efflux pump [Xanthobacter sp. SG618]|uniref:multidrug efflux RND transporter permease subunit n=1 Tax=Xanthobacter sp. SG618 TaxID=2587121 RepID=UPI00145F2A73|nr:multidrug efflux RND transporter permease subunit [Xanthobacter sp. SG618]NMN59683.1 HAE1 family hydrophobic/amphiphilic exporter-1/multidrug efflux pump [Xanthobacter sp. SG618]